MKNISNLWSYHIVAERGYHSDIGEYPTYGIRVNLAQSNRILHDISTCKGYVESIVELLNRHQLSPVHIYDVVSDLLP